MPSELRFDGKVVVISGAGGGLGKTYALFFAQRGALIVINDLGTIKSLDGSSRKAADLVAEEIIAKGGKAVTNYDSIEDGDKIIDTAIKAFGRVDVVINNAGILRDKSFSRMTDADWDLVHKIHVRGSYKLTKAAWPYMLNQNYGRIINTASAAGLYGNFGQANYASAKLALHGFALSLSKEGAKKNVLVNTIAPLAASKMTETIMPPDMLAKLNPEFIVPLVALLAHDNCPETGSVFEAGAGWIGKLRRERSKGAVFKADTTFTPGAVAAKWGEITSFKNPAYPQTIMDTDWVGLLGEATKISGNPSTPNPFRFDGKVAVVTGAGNGLGRAYALQFAKYGASVVVNDLGGTTHGQGSSSSAADKVVEEIKALGGKAVANYDSVEYGDKIVETAIQTFGRIDILVNNAGILRDKSFIKMTDADWDLVYNVHLGGTYKTSKAAWPHMLKQKYGRIINTASAVGLYGNFGQTNYAAAKAGIIAFSNTLALEGKKSNIYVNTVAPNAGTRITATVMPAEMVEALKPDYVAPLVAFLAHESTIETGGVFECGSGWISKVRWQRSGGVGFPSNQSLTPEHVMNKWAEIINFKDGRAHYPVTTQDSFSAVQSNFENVVKSISNGSLKSTGAPIVNIEAARKAEFAPHTFTYSERDVIMYALGVGAKKTDLDLIYENNDKFKSLPTFGVIPAFDCMVKNIAFGDYLPNFNPMMLLHGEQYLELFKPIPTSGKLTSEGRIIDIIDKGKGCTIVVGVTTKNEKGEIVCENEFTNFVRGIGGFGQGITPVTRKSAALDSNTPPNREPDAVIKEKVNPDQAALYRLSGDYNPLHIDPEMSKMGGFDVPILHGLCTFGIAGKHILKKYANNDVSLFKSIKVRFAKHVFPGETVETNMWKEGDKIIFVVRVVERDVISISNAAVELFAQTKIEKNTEKSTGGMIVEGFQASQVFSGIQASFKAKSDQERKSEVAKVKAVFAFEISNDGKTASWFVDLKNGEGLVSVGKPQKADMTVIVSDKDFMDLAVGKLNPQKAFMQGKIKVKGNVGLASKLDSVLKTQKSKM